MNAYKKSRKIPYYATYLEVRCIILFRASYIEGVAYAISLNSCRKLIMSDEIIDEYLNPELKPKKEKEKIVDYQALIHFIKSNFPISKTDYILQVVESLKNQPSYQPQIEQFASKLSNDDVDRLFEGIKASTKYK